MAQHSLPLVGRWKCLITLPLHCGTECPLGFSRILATAVGHGGGGGSDAACTSCSPIFLPLIFTILPANRNLWRIYVGRIGNSLQRAVHAKPCSPHLSGRPRPGALTDAIAVLCSGFPVTSPPAGVDHHGSNLGRTATACLGFYQMMMSGALLGMGVCAMTLSVPPPPGRWSSFCTLWCWRPWWATCDQPAPLSEQKQMTCMTRGKR